MLVKIFRKQWEIYLAYFFPEPDVQIKARPAVKTDQNSSVASKWFVTYLMLSSARFHMGLTVCLDNVGNKFLAFKNSIRAGESLENAGKYSDTLSRTHQVDWDLEFFSLKYITLLLSKGNWRNATLL